MSTVAKIAFADYPANAARALDAIGSMALAPENGRIRLHLLVDRTSVEVFGSDGRVSMSSCFLPHPADKTWGLFSTGGTAKVVSLKAYRLRSAWR